MFVDALVLPAILQWHSLVARIISWAAGTLLSSHSIPSWTVVGLGLLALLGVKSIVSILFGALIGTSDSPFHNYTKDTLDGAKWRWRWSGNRILDLWCFCPSCDAQLVHNEALSSTRFICERCPSDGTFGTHAQRGRTVTTIMGGGKEYALGATEREIRRRIRTGERGAPQ